MVAPASSSNGDFGEWNAFPGGQMPASAQTVENSGSDLFGAMTGGPAAAPAPAPAPAPIPSLNPISTPGSGPASADLFDLMAPTQSLTSSQSLNFSMNSTQSMTTVLPQSQSQVSMTAHILLKSFKDMHITTRQFYIFSLMGNHYILNNLRVHRCPWKRTIQFRLFNILYIS